MIDISGTKIQTRFRQKSIAFSVPSQWRCANAQVRTQPGRWPIKLELLRCGYQNHQTTTQSNRKPIKNNIGVSIIAAPLRE
jgi:hypothetical protein